MVPAEVDILLVEDEAADAEFVLRALRKRALDNAVHHVVDGAEALEFLFAKGRYADRAGVPGPRVVLLDLHLPKVSGREVLRQLRQHDGTRHLPVVAWTSSSDRTEMQACYALGINSYVVKPLDYGDFASAASEVGHYWLQRNRAERSDAGPQAAADR